MDELHTHQLVSKVEAQYLHRGAYLHGFLTLTEEWLHFARVSADGPELVWKSPIRHVDSADIDMIRNTVTFEFQGEKHVVRGEGTFALHKEFVSQFFSLSRADDERLVADGDAILLEGRASLSLDNSTRMDGTLAVTGTGIRFLTDQVIEARHSAIQGLAAPLDRITGLRLSGVRRGLELRVGNHTYQFWGAIVPRAYGVLSTLIGHVRQDPNSATDILTWRIGRFRGFVLQYGELLASNRKLTFVPTGKLDSFLGLDSEWTLEREQLLEIEVQGIGGRKIRITGKDGNESLFEQSNAREHLLALLEILLHDPKQASGRKRRPTMGVPRLEYWKNAHPYLSAEEMLFSAPAFFFKNPFHAQYGSVILGRHTSFFVPSLEEPDASQIIEFRSERLRPPEPGQLPSGHILLDDGSQSGHFLLGNKGVYAAEFWSLWRMEMDRSGKGHFHPDLKPGNENRREAYRAELPGSFTTVITLDESDEENTQPKRLQASCIDISIGGCCIITEESIPAASAYSIRLPTTETGRYIDLQFAIAHTAAAGQWSEKYRHGLRFVDLTDQEADEVEGMVMKLQRDEAFARAVRRAGIEETE